jgi:hypothetical protein
VKDALQSGSCQEKEIPYHPIDLIHQQLNLSARLSSDHLIDRKQAGFSFNRFG